MIARRLAVSSLAALSLALTWAGGAAAKEADAERRAAAFQSVLDCRATKDNEARLACYDAAAAKMGEAERRGDIVVIDRSQAAAAHKQAFGLPLPSLDFVTRALKPEEVDQIEGVVASAHADVNGRWTLALEGGAVWRQVSGDLSRPPKAGSKVSIRKGTLGSFLMNIDGQPSIKVHRDV